MEYSNVEIAEVLERAADAWESERLGWCQNKSFEYEIVGAVVSTYDHEIVPVKKTIAACSLGGIGLVTKDSDLRIAVTDALGAATGFPELPWDLGGAVVDWNDHPDRTKQEVIDKFKEVAKDLRNANN